jgi:hypothetical protein
MENIRGIKKHSQHLGSADLTPARPDIYERKQMPKCWQALYADDDYCEAQSKYAAYIPGSYSPTRCITLKGRPMMYAILVHRISNFVLWLRCRCYGFGLYKSGLFETRRSLQWHRNRCSSCRRTCEFMVWRFQCWYVSLPCTYFIHFEYTH